MQDYYTNVNKMSEDRLVDEIQSLYKKLMSLSQRSSIYPQVLQMIETAETAYQEKIFRNRYKSSKSSEVINIGQIDEAVYTPDYTSEELLLAVVSQYTKGR
jgi:tRNA A37 N6-isopentenylltransferase MiaA